MGIPETESFPHWNYYLALEDDLQKLSRYVEFTTDNYSTYSIELARILLLASAEIDVVAKQLCLIIDESSNANNIAEYRNIILSRYEKFPINTLLIQSYGLELKPWTNWANNESPLWWRAHNNVKHSRHTHFSDANLKNALNSVGALLLMILHLYSGAAGEGRLVPNPSLFQVGPPLNVDRLFWGGNSNLVYEID